MSESQFFHYKSGNTFLHKISPCIKIIMMVILTIASFYIPLTAGIFLWIGFVIFEYFVIKITIKDILTDLKPSLSYFCMLYIASFIINIISFKNSNITFNIRNLYHIFLPNISYISLFIHLGLSIQITSIFYRTTSTMQFNDGLSTIERSITRKQQTPFADLLSLTITFIPRITIFWQRINTAWKARNGKENINKISVLVPILFRVSMHEAYLKALARQNRTEYNFSTNSEVYICGAPHAENLMTK